MSVNNSSASTPFSYKMINNNSPIIQNQSILSILTSDPTSFPSTPPNCSLRRTLSFDMSSPKSPQQNNPFSSSPLKRAQSSEHLHALGDAEYRKQPTNEEKKGAFEDIWSSILSQQNISGSGSGCGCGSGQLPPPYVHPLVKRSASSLSEKSLEICTESLGSETGSDRFSYPPSDPDEPDEKEPQPEEPQETQPIIIKKNNVVEEELNQKQCVEPEYYYSPSKRVGPGPSPTPWSRTRSSFPPPLPSLTHHDGSNLHLRSHRLNGRLVVEAVSVPSQNCFRAQRHDGRLLLTIANDDDEENDNEEQKSQNQGVEEEAAEEIYEDEVRPKLSQNGMINVHPLIMSKLTGLINTRNNSTWRRNINATVIRTLDNHQEEEKASLVKPPLPPRPRVARVIPNAKPTTATALNAYEYYWRRTTTGVAVLGPIGCPQVGKEKERNGFVLGYNGKVETVGQEGVVVVKDVGGGGSGEREKEGEYLVPLPRGCKEPRRSLLFLEPCCIATS